MPMDTNAAQFERQGNPWISERERQEFSWPNRKALKENLRPKKAQDLGNFPKPAAKSRDSLAEFQRIRRGQDFLNRFEQALGGSRTVAPTGDRLITDMHVGPARATELTPRQLKLRAEQRLEVERRCEHASREEEKQRLRHIIAAAKARLERLG